MKKLISLLCGLIMLVCASALVGCNDLKNDYVNVIIVDINNVEEGGTLKDYMDYLKEECDFKYEIKNGMVTSIDGLKARGTKYWMLYTNDMENANEAWGTYDYEGEICYSATVGAEDLVVKDGFIYVWLLQAY